MFISTFLLHHLIDIIRFIVSFDCQDFLKPKQTFRKLCDWLNVIYWNTALVDWFFFLRICMFIPDIICCIPLLVPAIKACDLDKFLKSIGKDPSYVDLEVSLSRVYQVDSPSIIDYIVWFNVLVLCRLTLQ